MTSRREQAADYWMQALREDHAASSIAGLQAATEAYAMTLNGHPFCTCLRPLFVERSQVSAAYEAAEAVMRAIGIAARALLRDTNMRREAGFPPYLDSLIDLDKDVAKEELFGRIDGVFDRSGCIQFLEYNSDAGGLPTTFESSRALARLPIAADVGRRFPFTVFDNRDHFVDALVEDAREHGRPVPVSIILPSGFPAITNAERPWMSYAASRGCRVIYADLAKLDVRADGVYVNGAPAGWIEVELKVLTERAAELAPLIGALKRGNVHLISGASQAVLRSNKLTFAVLSDPEYASLFDSDSQRALQQHVPWTRRLRAGVTTHAGRKVDLLSHVAAHREDFVLKPAGGTGGEGVVLGWTVDQTRWEAALKQATKRPHVVQQRVLYSREVFPMLVDGKIVEQERSWDFNPFTWNGRRAEGVLVRVGEDLLNVSARGSGAGVFVLDSP